MGQYIFKLRKHVNGETLEVIDNLVHSPVAYDIANERLEIKKKAEQRRQTTM